MANELDIPDAEIVRAFEHLANSENPLVCKTIEPVAMMVIDFGDSQPLRRELGQILLKVGQKYPGTRVQELAIAYLLQSAVTTSSVAAHSWAKRYSGTNTRRLLGIETD